MIFESRYRIFVPLKLNFILKFKWFILYWGTHILLSDLKKRIKLHLDMVHIITTLFIQQFFPSGAWLMRHTLH